MQGFLTISYVLVFLIAPWQAIIENRKSHYELEWGGEDERSADMIELAAEMIELTNDTGGDDNRSTDCYSLWPARRRWR
jgi:hypothetical protein